MALQLFDPYSVPFVLVCKVQQVISFPQVVRLFCATAIVVCAGLANASAAFALCNGLAPTITGTASGETVYGTSGDDVIETLGGNDTIWPGEGNDTICAGDGADTIWYSGGSDWADGGSDADSFRMGTVTEGSDTFVGGAGADTVDYQQRSAALAVTMGDELGNDGAAGESDNVGGDVEHIYGGSGADSLTGNDLANNVTGLAGSDTLNGGGGDDIFPGEYATSGADAINGGAGWDTLDYQRPTGISVTMGDGLANDGGAGEGDNVGSDIERLQGSWTDDVLVGTSADEYILGSIGNDTITGGGGADTLEGNDGNDVFIEGAAASGTDTFKGGNGTDTVDYSQRTNAVVVTMGDGTANDGEALENDNFWVMSGGPVENVIGSSAGDTITGDTLANVLSGGPGADTLAGGDGNDTFDEGAASNGGSWHRRALGRTPTSRRSTIS